MLRTRTEYGIKTSQVKGIRKEIDSKNRYLHLGTTTRYADVCGRTRASRSSGEWTYRNVIAFVGPCAVIHLGDVTPRPAADDVPCAFLVIDRCDVHSVINELKTGNTLYADTYSSNNIKSPSNTHWPYRAQWTKEPSFGLKSTQFHRWLLGLNAVCIEHLNDLALDCRRDNLQAATTTHQNVQTQHRLKYAYWHAGVSGTTQTALDLQESQKLYWNLVQQCPPLPDCVFACKRLKRKYNMQPDSTGLELVKSKSKVIKVKPADTDNKQPEIIDLT